MILDLVLFAAGLAALAAGADWLVTGAVRLADSAGVAPLVIGLTVVAFGTSAPELMVSVGAAWRGQGGLALGNVMGSTVANVGLIVGVTALFTPVAIHRRLLARETPLVVAVLAVVLALCYNAALGRLDGLVLLAVFALYLAFLLRWALPGHAGAAREMVDEPESLAPGAVLEIGSPASAGEVAGEPRGESGDRDAGGTTNRGVEVGRTAVGLAALLLGAHLLVEGATGLARVLGVPEAVVGASLVAVGTSLPELASSAAAAARGLGDVAVGNVLGSNVFNLGLVLGASALARPIQVETGTVVTQVLPALAFSLLLVPLAYTGRRVSRAEGLLLLAAYGGFLAWIF